MIIKRKLEVIKFSILQNGFFISRTYHTQNKNQKIKNIKKKNLISSKPNTSKQNEKLHEEFRNNYRIEEFKRWLYCRKQMQSKGIRV